MQGAVRSSLRPQLRDVLLRAAHENVSPLAILAETEWPSGLPTHYPPCSAGGGRHSSGMTREYDLSLSGYAGNTPTLRKRTSLQYVICIHGPYGDHRLSPHVG